MLLWRRCDPSQVHSTRNSRLHDRMKGRQSFHFALPPSQRRRRFLKSILAPPLPPSVPCAHRVVTCSTASLFRPSARSCTQSHRGRGNSWGGEKFTDATFQLVSTKLSFSPLPPFHQKEIKSTKAFSLFPAMQMGECLRQSPSFFSPSSSVFVSRVRVIITNVRPSVPPLNRRRRRRRRRRHHRQVSLPPPARSDRCSIARRPRPREDRDQQPYTYHIFERKY